MAKDVSGVGEDPLAGIPLSEVLDLVQSLAEGGDLSKVPTAALFKLYKKVDLGLSRLEAEVAPVKVAEEQVRSLIRRRAQEEGWASHKAEGLLASIYEQTTTKLEDRYAALDALADEVLGERSDPTEAAAEALAEFVRRLDVFKLTFDSSALAEWEVANPGKEFPGAAKTKMAKMSMRTAK